MPFCLGETRILLLDVSPQRNDVNESAKSCITFIVDSDSRHRQRFMDHETHVELGRRGLPVVPPKVEVYEEDFMACSSYREASSQISSLVDSLDINPEDKRQICSSIAGSVRSTVRVTNSSPGNKNRMWMIKLEMYLQTTYWWKAMIPACPESIAALEKGRAVDFAETDYHGQKSCCICLKEFQEESVVKRMPCSHIFDDKCIDGWLSKSRCCPICRYQMPSSLYNQ